MNACARPIHISVVGGSAEDSDSTWYELAEEVGALVAERGCVLVNGGGSGTMVASARGAKRAGGTTVAILPGMSRSEANLYVDHAVPTGMGHLRNTVVVHSADAVIALPGSWGTLSEIAMARVWNKPVVALPFWAHFFGEHGSEMGFGGVHFAKDAGDAVSMALTLVQEQTLRVRS